MSEAAASLGARVRKLCDTVAADLGEKGRERVYGAAATLDEPLRLAVAGRVSVGKSTLVNALVGRRIAPTDAGECTKVVTWYRFGGPDQARVLLRDGTTRPVRLVEHGLPAGLDVPTDEVDRLEVLLSSRPLRDLTLIDTPGLDTLTEANEAATRRAVLGGTGRSRRAAGDADALLFLIGDATRRADADFIEEFRVASGTGRAGAINTVAVLSRADRFGSGPLDPQHPLEIARGVAADLARAHPAEFADVVAVSGLLAESARTGLLSEGVASRLAALAGSDAVTLAMRAGDPALAGLFALLGTFGVTWGRDSAATGGAAGLAAWSIEQSGIGAVETAIRQRLLPRTQVLKAARILAVIEGVGRGLPNAARSRVLTALEDAQLDPALHPIRELGALQNLLVQSADSELVPQLCAFVDGSPMEPTDPDAARERSSGANKAAALATDPVEAQAARVLARSYQLLARQLEAGVTS